MVCPVVANEEFRLGEYTGKVEWGLVCEDEERSTAYSYTGEGEKEETCTAAQYKKAKEEQNCMNKAGEGQTWDFKQTDCDNNGLAKIPILGGLINSMNLVESYTCTITNHNFDEIDVIVKTSCGYKKL